MPIWGYHSRVRTIQGIRQITEMSTIVIVVRKLALGIHINEPITARDLFITVTAIIWATLVAVLLFL
jgi:uncharacterized membrane protein YcaP (DUF421 family)